MSEELDVTIDNGILFVGDLHLSNRELRSTKKMVDNNEVMLDNLYNFVKEHEEVNLIIFLGDIQHTTPYGKNTLKETTKWVNQLQRLGKLMLSRLSKNKLSVQLRNQDENNFDLSIPFSQQIMKHGVLPLFTLRGNHDVDKDGSFTFFDLCIKEGYLINPRRLLIGDTQYNFHNYGELNEAYDVFPNAENIVGIYHDVIPTGEGEQWMIFDFEAKKHEETIDDILDRVDLAVVGHVHKKYEPITHVFEHGGTNSRGRDSVVWYVGSMGRTASDTGQVRDVGYCGLVQVGDIEHFGTVEIDIIKASEYFDLGGIVKRKKERQEFKDFKLGLEDTIHNDSLSPIEIIHQSVEDEDIRQLCVELVTEVMEG